MAIEVVVEVLGIYTSSHSSGTRYMDQLAAMFQSVLCPGNPPIHVFWARLVSDVNKLMQTKNRVEKRIRFMVKIV